MSKQYILRGSLLQRLRGQRQMLTAVDSVSFDVPEGEIMGIVGESGSGKSTVAQIVTGLVRPTSGALIFQGSDLAKADSKGWRQARRSMQMVFQDTHSSLNPRKRIRKVLDEALAARGLAATTRHAEIEVLIRQVGLDEILLGRFPHELSGGQRQRVGLARALAIKPKLLIADEPVSSLDVSLQGQIINLLQDINRSLGVTIMLISHDLAVVARICSSLVVMNKGGIVEAGAPEKVLKSPEHPYTRTLLAAVPRGLKGRSARAIGDQLRVANSA